MEGEEQEVEKRRGNDNGDSGSSSTYGSEELRNEEFEGYRLYDNPDVGSGLRTKAHIGSERKEYLGEHTW